MIRVKLLPRRAPGPRLSISTRHLRVVLISQTRRRSFCRRVRLLQNDLSTPSSPRRTLINAAYFPFPCCHGYSFGRDELYQKRSGVVKTPLHTYLCYVALIPSFWSPFDGDIKPGGIQDVPYETYATIWLDESPILCGHSGWATLFWLPTDTTSLSAVHR